MNISVNVTNKIATAVGAPVIVCGNSDYSITFAFDSEWLGHSVKTARFVYKLNGEYKYQDVVFNGNTVPVPTVSKIETLYVGVYSGDLITTTPARIVCKKSILCSDPTPQPAPADDVYAQLITLINTKINEVSELPAVTAADAGKMLVVDASGAWGKSNDAEAGVAKSIKETNEGKEIKLWLSEEGAPTSEVKETLYLYPDEWTDANNVTDTLDGYPLTKDAYDRLYPNGVSSDGYVLDENGNKTDELAKKHIFVTYSGNILRARFAERALIADDLGTLKVFDGWATPDSFLGFKLERGYRYAVIFNDGALATMAIATGSDESTTELHLLVTNASSVNDAFSVTALLVCNQLNDGEYEAHYRDALEGQIERGYETVTTIDSALVITKIIKLEQVF